MPTLGGRVGRVPSRRKDTMKTIFIGAAALMLATTTLAGAVISACMLSVLMISVLKKFSVTVSCGNTIATPLSEITGLVLGVVWACFSSFLQALSKIAVSAARM